MRRKCECGCGESVKPGNRFIYGHQCRGKKHSLKTRRKMSKAAQGRVVSEETKAKMSEARVGLVHSEETKAKISEAQKGKIVSEETKAKISSATKGKIVSEETREKISDAHKKDDSNWAKYHPYTAHYQYERLQDKVRNRDRRRCVVCNEKKRIDTHHIVPLRVGYKSRLCDHESNMVALCSSCHHIVEPSNSPNRGKWKEFLPYAKKYLSKFGYKEMLLNEYLKK